MFIPPRHRWSRFGPWYRYGIFFAGIGLLFFLWRYGLYAWLDAAIMQEQATICQLQQHITQKMTEERQHKERVQQLSPLKNLCSQGLQCCVGSQCSDQCAYIFAEAQKAHLQIEGYLVQKLLQQQDGKQRQSVTIVVRGTLDQIESFLALLKKSARLVQCTSLAVRHAEDKIYIAECTIQFITYLL